MDNQAGFFVTRRAIFNSIPELVEHYRHEADGLCTNLRYNLFIVTLYSGSHLIGLLASTALNVLNVLESEIENKFSWNLKSLANSLFVLLFTFVVVVVVVVVRKVCLRAEIPQTAGLSRAVNDQWEIERSQIQLVRKLGHGMFGEVWQG